MSTLKDKITLLKRIINFVIQENKWQDKVLYGLIGDNVILRKPRVIAEPKNVYLYPYSRLQSDARILNYTGKFILKSYAVCSDSLLVVTGNHVPTVGIPQYFLGISHINDRERDVIIDEGAWIGANVTLLSGAHIGRGAVIGAGAIINGKVPPYAVVSGISNTIVATTFSIQQILSHEKLIFKEEDRLSEDYLNQLFAIHYVGLKSIGTNRIKEQDLYKYNEIQNVLKHYQYN